MNIKLIKEKWIKFYKRGFFTGLMVLCFLCLIDQTLQTPFFFNKIKLIIPQKTDPNKTKERVSIKLLLSILLKKNGVCKV